MDMLYIIESLSKKRFVFHSEKDFQFALAWEIKSIYPNSQIRLEVPCVDKNGRMAIDIIVFHNGKHYPIEIKYKKAEFSIEINNEYFILRKHGKTTDSCPEFIEDIERVEKQSERLNNGIRLGFAIWLTNEKYYWNIQKSDIAHAPFFVHEGATINGVMQRTMVRGKKELHQKVELSGDYTVHWDDYHDFNKKNGKFKYALFSVK